MALTADQTKLLENWVRQSLGKFEDASRFVEDLAYEISATINAAGIAPSYLELGVDPAGAGLIRLTESAGGIQFRRTIGGTDIVGLELEDETLFLGGNGAGPSLSSLSIVAATGTTGGFFVIDANGIQMAVGGSIASFAGEITTSGFVSIGSANHPTAGLLRLSASEGGIQFGDGIGGTLGSAVDSDGTDLTFGALGYDITNFHTLSQYLFNANSATQLSIIDTLVDAQDNEIRTTGFASLGSDPASAGLLRLGNAQGGIQFDDGSPGTPLRALEADSSSLWVGEAGFNDTQYFADTQHLFVAGAATQLSIVDGTIDAQDCEIRTTGNISVGAAPATGTGIRLDYGVGLGLHGKDSLGVSHSMLEFGASGELQLGSTTIDQLNIAWESGQSAFFYTGNGDILRLADGVIEPLADIIFHKNYDNPVIYHDSDGTNATGDQFVIEAQSGSTTGGNLLLHSGSGGTTHGSIVLAVGSGAETIATLSAGLANFDNNEIRTTGFIALGTDPADTGAIRLANNTGIYWEATTPGSDLLGLFINNFDTIVIGSTITNGTFVDAKTGATHRFSVNTVDQLRISETLINCQDNEIRTTGFLSVNGTGVDSGAIRLGNNLAIMSEESGGTDRRLAHITSGNIMAFGDPSIAVVGYWGGSAGGSLTAADGNPRMAWNNTGVSFQNVVTPIAKPTVTGSRGGNAALASLLTALANYGLVTDSSS